MSDKEKIEELNKQVEVLKSLIFALSEKLYIVAQHLARLAEKKELREHGRNR